MLPYIAYMDPMGKCKLPGCHVNKVIDRSMVSNRHENSAARTLFGYLEPDGSHVAWQPHLNHHQITIKITTKSSFQ